MALLRRGVIELTLESAWLVLDATMAHAAGMGVPMDVAVADSGGVLLAFARMDGAKRTSVEIAVNKAFTAACTRLPTSAYASIAGAGGAAFGIHASHGGRFTVFGGGVPLMVEGQCVGAVGCSGGSAAQDEEAACAGAAALTAAVGAEATG